MESLLHSPDDDGYTMAHWAAANGHAGVMQLVVGDYKLDPAARDKVSPVRYNVCSGCGLSDESAHM